MSSLTDIATFDIRFPTSTMLDGSDAMNPDPDYSAAYLSLATDAGDGLVGAGFVFTTGRGNNVAAAAIQRAIDLAMQPVGALAQGLRLASQVTGSVGVAALLRDALRAARLRVRHAPRA